VRERRLLERIATWNAGEQRSNETQVDVLQLMQAPDEKPRTGKQDRGERHLQNHQGPSKP